MLRQLRTLFRTERPLPAHLHYHVDDNGRKFVCDETICRPAPRQPRPFLPHHW